LLTSALLCGPDDQLSEIVSESRWRLAVFATAWRFASAGPLRGNGIQDPIEFRVDIAIRIHVIMRPNEQDARAA
jgi:hypothetical protein